jgi:hypothetical protein
MKTLLLTQAVYYLITGIWPLVHIRSFVKVTGPKTDIWLVKTVGLLITAIALTLLFGALNNETGIALLVLSVTSAFGLLCVDVYYPLRGRISKIYLVDAVVEMVFVVWAVVELMKVS